MIETIFAEQSAPFAVAIGLMLLLAAVEGVGLLFGIAVSGIVDTLLPDFNVPDIDVPDIDAPDLDFDVDMGMKPMTPETSAELLEFFDATVAGFTEKLAGYSDEDFCVLWKMRKGDQAMGEMPRVGAVRAFDLNHLYHHRGQLSVYLRLLDVPLPMIYGPTADEQGPFA